MTLNEYLTNNGIALAVFAKAVGCTPEAVRLWARQQRMPRPSMIEAIQRETHGAVSPADWFDKPSKARAA